MAASSNNYGLQKKSELFIEFIFIWVNNLKFFDDIKLLFFYKIFSFLRPFCRPWTLSSGLAAPPPPPSRSRKQETNFIHLSHLLLFIHIHFFILLSEDPGSVSAQFNANFFQWYQQFCEKFNTNFSSNAVTLNVRLAMNIMRRNCSIIVNLQDLLVPPVIH
jgi:hypothetical protein